MISLLQFPLKDFEGEIHSLLDLSFCALNYNDLFGIQQHQKGLLGIPGLHVVKANGTKQAQARIGNTEERMPKGMSNRNMHRF